MIESIITDTVTLIIIGLIALDYILCKAHKMINDEIIRLESEDDTHEQI